MWGPPVVVSVVVLSLYSLSYSCRPPLCRDGAPPFGDVFISLGADSACMHSRVLARARARIFLMKGTQGLLARARRGGCGALIMQWALFAADRSSLPRWRARPRRGWAGGRAAGLASLDAAAAPPPRAWSVLQLLFECSACTVCATAAMEHGLFGLLAMGAAWHGLAAAEAADGRALPALMRGTYSVLTRVAPAGERVEESGRVGW